jgi:hypothetical protein
MSTRLPKALAPWAKQLQLLPEEIAAALGALTAQIAHLLGAGGEATANHGEPDGMHGIAQRGSYEQLLASEWLLHTELPDEFLRRAIAGEHLFYERAYAHAPAIRQTLVLWDAGPDQLGAPRIVQLALLVAFVQRAEHRAAKLSWGSMQDPDCVLEHEFTAASVTRWLRARTHIRPTSADLERWRATPAWASAKDRWAVGGATLRRLCAQPDFARIELEEVLAPEVSKTQKVQLVVRTPSAIKQSEVTLTLPPAALSVRLLRDPFANAVAPAQNAGGTIDMSTNILFSADGKYMYVRGTENNLMTVWVPNSPRAKVPPPARYQIPKGQRIIAVGRPRRNSGKAHTVVVTASDTAFHVHRLSKLNSSLVSATRHEFPDDTLAEPERPMTSRRMVAGPANLNLMPLFAAELTGGGAYDGLLQVYFVSREGELVQLESSGKTNYRAQIFSPAVLAQRATMQGLSHVRADASGAPTLVFLNRWDSRTVAESQSEVLLTGYVANAPLFWGNRGSQDVIAYRNGGHWIVATGTARIAARVSPRFHVVGVLGYRSGNLEDLLVVIDATRTRLGLGVNGTPTILTSDAPIRVVAVSDASSDIVYVTENGDLVVYSYSFNAVTLRIRADAAEGVAT